jgi:isopenicillin N synthase-like dioxygenase
MPRTSTLNYRDAVSASADTSGLAIRCTEILQGDWGRCLPIAERACNRDGYLSLQLDARSRRVLGATLDSMRAFFAQDGARKEACSADADGHGWSPPFREPAYQPDTVSNLESFDIVRDSAVPESSATWPELHGFRHAVADCWRCYARIGDAVLELLARVSGIDPTRFVAACGSRELNTLRLLHYAPSVAAMSGRDVGIAAHTDFECITLLYQSAPGLELRRPDGRWLDAPVTGDRLVVLFGDMLETWTNGRIPATGHRVRRSPAERFSIVMFVAVDDDVTVAPLQDFLSAGESPRYAAVRQAAHIDAEIRRAKTLAFADRAIP